MYTMNSSPAPETKQRPRDADTYHRRLEKHRGTYFQEQLRHVVEAVRHIEDQQKAASLQRSCFTGYVKYCKNLDLIQTKIKLAATQTNMRFRKKCIRNHIWRQKD